MLGTEYSIYHVNKLYDCVTSIYHNSTFKTHSLNIYQFIHAQLRQMKGAGTSSKQLRWVKMWMKTSFFQQFLGWWAAGGKCDNKLMITNESEMIITANWPVQIDDWPRSKFQVESASTVEQIHSAEGSSRGHQTPFDGIALSNRSLVAIRSLVRRSAYEPMKTSKTWNSLLENSSTGTLLQNRKSHEERETGQYYIKKHGGAFYEGHVIKYLELNNYLSVVDRS